MLTVACRGTVRRLRLLRCVHFAIRYKLEWFRARIDAAVAVILDRCPVPLDIECEYLGTWLRDPSRSLLLVGCGCTVSWVAMANRYGEPEHRAAVTSDL